MENIHKIENQIIILIKWSKPKSANYAKFTLFEHCNIESY